MSGDTPYPYQTEGVDWLSRQVRGCLLADDMGLGKTIQAALAAKKLKFDRCLIVTTATMRLQWQREWRRWHGGPAAPILRAIDGVPLVGAVIISWAMAEALRERLIAYRWDVLILDEVHNAKNRLSKRGQAVFGPKGWGIDGLASVARKVWGLSGTPMLNEPSELWPMMSAMFPESLRHEGRLLSFRNFVEEYCVLGEKRIGRKMATVITGGKNLQALKTHIAPYVLRRKIDIVKLPPLRITPLVIDAEDFAGRIEELEAHPEFSTIRQLTAAITARARLSATDDRAERRELLDVIGDNHVALGPLRRLLALAKADALVPMIHDALQGGAGKIVIFAIHKEAIARLRTGLAEWQPVVIDGSTPIMERQENIDRFQLLDAFRVFIAQIQAAGSGVTLTAARYGVFCEESWSPMENRQAIFRMYRIGQKHPCLVRYAVVAGSVDEQLGAICMRKLADIDQVMA